MSGEAPTESSPAGADDLASVDRAMATLEAQRAILGDDVVDTALAPLRARRAELETPRSEQRRLVTVVFADLVDFTVLSRRLDAEDTREVVGAYFARWQREIEDQGGVVEKFIGDAVMAVFGLRHSFEDDAQRAVRSALSMLAALEELNAEFERRFAISVHMRVGVDTGEVVVSTLDERAGQDFVAVGPTVNRAARLQAAAPVDRVLISHDTFRQVRASFVLEKQPALRLKGIDEPVDAYVVKARRELGFRLDHATGVEGVESATIGRDLQLRYLQDRLEDVTEESRWRVVTVVGEAGVGKSRLLYDFDTWLGERIESVWWFRGRASPSTRNSSHGLLRDVLNARMGIQVDDPNDVVRRKLADGFENALGSEEGRHTAALVGAWLGYDVGGDAAEVPASPQALRDRATEALGGYFRHLAGSATVVILLEDLHWADDGSLRWLDAVDPVLHEAPVVVVASARPAFLEERPHWGEGLGHHERLPLAPLSRRESRELVGELLRHVEDLPESLVTTVVDAAEGNPFYIEELVTWLIDAGVVVTGEERWTVAHEVAGAVVVPSTLKGVLQSRLDSLSAVERDLLQRASVVGRVFWDQAVSHLQEPPDDVEQSWPMFAGLRGREILLERATSRFASAREYLFKHALLRDVAYDGVLRARRRAYHLRAAEWLTVTSTAVDRTDEYASVIAEHYELAGDPAAAGWFLRAGLRAASVYALTEAGQLLDRAGALVGDQPELRFDILLAQEDLHDRLGERESQRTDLEAMGTLADQVDPVRSVQLFLAQARSSFQHSEYDVAVDQADRAVELAAEIHRSDLGAEATLWRGKALTWAERTDEARVVLDQAVEQAREAGADSVLGEALRYLAMLASNLGENTTSLEYGHQARDIFAALGDTEMESAALAQLATTHYNLGEYAEAQAVLEETLPIFRQSGHRYREAVNTGNLAGIALARGRLADALRWADEAIELARDLQEMEATGVDLLIRAGVQTLVGKTTEAEATLQEALTIGRQLPTSNIVVDALTRRAFNELCSQRPDSALASAREAVRTATEAETVLEMGPALMVQGHAAALVGFWGEAREAFAAAREQADSMALASQVREADVGLALVTTEEGDPAAGLTALEPALAFLDVAGLSGSTAPGETLREAVRVLELAADPRAADVRDAARAYLDRVAAEIGDEELAAGFLALPTHQALRA